MFCSNCGKPLKEFDEKQRICIHGVCNDGGGVSIGGKHFLVNPDLCCSKCAREYFTNALDAINDKCESCVDLYSASFFGEELSCSDPRCPYIIVVKERKRRDEICKRVVERDGGWIKHIIKTCDKFYFG
jgi:hypothetical protein